MAPKTKRLKKTASTQEPPVPPLVCLIPPQPYIPPPIPPTQQPHIPSMSTHPHVPPLMAPTPHPHIPPPMAPTSHPHVPPLVDTTQQPYAGHSYEPMEKQLHFFLQHVVVLLQIQSMFPLTLIVGQRFQSHTRMIVLTFERIYFISRHQKAKLHQNHLHQHHLLTCTAYTIIANHKQIGTCENHCYGSYTVTPGGVPKCEHSSQRPKTTKLVSQLLRRAIYLDPSVLATTSTLTPTTLANPSHNSRVPRVHPPFRATTQQMLFRARTQGIPRALTPILSHNSKDTFRATIQGTPAIPPLKHHQKPRRSHLQNQQHQYCCSKIALRGTRTAKRCPLPNRMEEHAVLTRGSMEELEEVRWWRDVGPRDAEDGGVMETRGRRRSGWSHDGAGVAGLRCWSAMVAAFRRERDVVAAVWQ
ncbi:hypothetical protein DEO72_LG7g1983 [Vigna unguiculata]|uniref:Uncharacterized protein n=1 Tax=Vigna unguiculata TaxID=3917 RepID=A0A4D6MGZ1_VIGUN|nr:hypothetical protein DEO72_LG7g1983 [Vigna unguiculata]